MANESPPDKIVKPVEDPQFWNERLYRTLATGGMLHEIIYQESWDIWARTQTGTSIVLHRLIPKGSKVLDAGCGYGALVDAFDECRLRVQYTGVDVSPDLFRLATERYQKAATSDGKPRFPGVQFLVGNLRSLPFESEEFDWAVMRSMRRMVEDNCGRESWQAVLAEVQRVARRVLLIEYLTPTCSEVAYETCP